MRTFIDEMLEEIEAKEKVESIEFNKIQADQALAAIAKLDAQIAEANSIVDQEIALIERFRTTEVERIEKKRSWLLFNLEPFMRRHNEATEEKTLRLPHGSLTLRKGRDKVEVQDMDAFLKVATKYNLLRTTPEEHAPDLKAIGEYLRRTGEIPPGIKVTPATINFNYQLTTNGDAHEQ